MVSAAQRNSDLITYLPAERRYLGKAQMMRIARTPATHQAGLPGDGFHMLAVANPPRRL
jgi:hypothetical protein